MKKEDVSDKKEVNKSFFGKLVKYFVLPFLLLFSMSLFPDDISAMMIIACLIVLYFLIVALIFFIRFLIFLFHIRKVNFFREGKTLVIQLLKN